MPAYRAKEPVCRDSSKARIVILTPAAFFESANELDNAGATYGPVVIDVDHFKGCARSAHPRLTTPKRALALFKLRESHFRQCVLARGDDDLR